LALSSSDPDSPAWLRPAADGCTLNVHVQPGAKRSEVVGEHGDALKIRVASPPVDGRANEALIAFLATRLGVAKGSVELLAGDSSRKKRLAVRGVSAQDVCARLISG
jgi:uncharacterized protein